MSNAAKDILNRIPTWPEEDQEELAELANEIEARRSGVYRLSAEDREALKQSQADVDAARFASDERMQVIFNKARSIDS